MANTELNILLKLKDGITAGILKAQKGLNKFGYDLQDLGRKTEWAGKKFAFLGASITGGFAVAMANTKSKSDIVRNALSSLETGAQSLQLTIANSVAPVVARLGTNLQSLADWFNRIDPAIRNTAIQVVAVTGLFMTFSGVIMSIGGKLMQLIGSFAAWIAAMNPVTIVILSIVAAIGTMVIMWEKVRSVVLPVISGIEIAWRAFSIAYAAGMEFMIRLLMEFNNKLISALLVMAQIPGQEMFGQWALSMQKVNVELESMAKNQQTIAREHQTAIAQILSGQGQWKDSVDRTVLSIRDTFKKLFSGIQQDAAKTFDVTKEYFKRMAEDAAKRGAQMGDAYSQHMKSIVTASKKTVDGMQVFKNGVSEIAKTSGSMLTDNLGMAFANIIMGTQSASQAFADFGRIMLMFLVQMIAKLLVVLALVAMLNAIPGGSTVLKAMDIAGSFHAGGKVPKKAHTGMKLANDEVPIIAQAGEGIISRRGMNRLGGYNFDRMNRGDIGGAGGGGQTVNYYIQAVDPESFASMLYANRASVHVIVQEGMRNNTSLRNTMTRYM